MRKTYYSEFYPYANEEGVVGTTMPALTEARVTEIIEDIGIITDDSVLTADEKTRILIPLHDELEITYDNVSAQATAFGINITQLNNARSAWIAYLNSLSPAWDDETQNTNIDREVFRQKINEYLEHLSIIQANNNAEAARRADVNGGLTDNGTPVDRAQVITSEGTSKDTANVSGVSSSTLISRLKSTEDISSENKEAVANLQIIYGDTVNSATNAANSAASAAEASQAKADAIIAKGQAQTSASDAAKKATDAAGSATEALTSRNQASTFATNASNSATDAAGSASTATTQAGLAANSATAAGGSATAAAGSASTAATKANEAGNSATAANASKVAAESARDTADQKATAAASSASSAATSSTQAGQSASAAQTAKTAAETARAGAETAQTSAANSATTATGAASTATTQAGIATTAKNDAQAASNAAVTAKNQASSFADAAGVSAAASQASSVTASTARNEALAALAQQGRLNLVQKSRVSAAPVAFPDTASGWGYRLVGGTTGTRISYVGPLKTNTPYSISFKARRVSGTTSTMNVDLFPDTLPERVFTVTSDQWTEYKWEGLTSAHADMTSENVQLRFFQASLPSGHTFEVADIKLEEGATATAWTPNPKDIELSASAAATSASNAAASETAAGQSASAASTAKTQAETARGQAQTAATQASSSRDDAAGSAASASSSATQAANSRDAAAGSASAAAGSASTATTKAGEAGTHAAAALASQVSASAAKDAAVSAKDAAEAARGQAQTSASAAATSAASAAASDTAAGQSATAASGSATTASTKAGEASTFASQASTSAGNAAGSATTASTASGVAVTARDQANDARDAAQGSAATALAQAASASASASAASTSANLAASTSAVRGNLLPNGGMERGLEGISGPNLYVSNDSWGPAVRVAPAGNGTYEIQWAPVNIFGGATYTVSGDALLFADSGYRYFDMQFFDSAGAVVKDGGQKPMGPGDYSNDRARINDMAWTEQAPANATKVVVRAIFENVVNPTAMGARRVKLELGAGPATAYTADAAVGALSAELNITAATTADIATRMATAKFEVVAAAGSDPAQLLIRADNSGSLAALVAQEIAFSNVVGGTIVRVMRIVNGSVFITGVLTVGTPGGGRIVIDGVNFRIDVYDGNNTLRVRLGRVD